MENPTDRNRLGDETSPYLIQHKGNPVHWQAWGPDALAAAKTADKPILLSIGYAACHWCHVMAHESFENAAIAALMNDGFVNIKVDREERPDLDAIYQNALALMGEHGGWPLTMFLTPEGEPFWGGTYFPPEPRWGRPGFPQLLDAIGNAYQRKREDRSLKNVAALRQGLAKLGQPQPGEGGIAPELFDRVAERLLREVDPLNGGIGTAPKFPQCGIFELLWRAWKLHAPDAIPRCGCADADDDLARRHLRPSRRRVCPLRHRCALAGAAFRGRCFTTMPNWSSLLTLVWQGRRATRFTQRGSRRPVGWLEREMTHPDGGFYASLDADSEHEEGKFYVWSKAEVDAVLRDRSPLFKHYYDVSAEGNWEGHNILNRLDHPAPADEATEAALQRNAAGCCWRRGRRGSARVSTTRCLADWNGLIIAALAEAGLAFDRPKWIALAARAFGFVTARMASPDGRLHHSWRDGRARHPASVDDYANLLSRRAGPARGDQRRSLSRPRTAVGRDTRHALLGRSGRRLLFCRCRHRRPDRPRQNRRGRCGPGRQRDAGRRLDPAGAADRR